jgi:hypothetical protein
LQEAKVGACTHLVTVSWSRRLAGCLDGNRGLWGRRDV